MEYTDFPIEFRNDATSSDSAFFEEIETRLRDLASGHRDITGAAVSLEAAAERETPLFEATVVVYIRPNDLAAVEKSTDPLAALQGALSAIERQVREQRDKLAGR